MFDGECLCDGPVENWLNSVVDAMKQALFAEYQRALPAYDTMKRSTEWIYEFSAQNTIVVSRTFFTQEVNEAFEELEDGNEDALKVRAQDIEPHCQPVKRLRSLAPASVWRRFAGRPPLTDVARRAV